MHPPAQGRSQIARAGSQESASSFGRSGMGISVPEFQTGRAGDVTTVIAAPQHRAVSCGSREPPF